MSTRTLVDANAASRTTLATSQEIRDRGSTFVGYVYHAPTVVEAKAVLARHNVAEGAHAQGNDAGRPYAIAAWRCMVVKPGRTGLGGPDDFVVHDGCEDGGERWAGGRVLGVMKREGVIDAVVVVCRWFGGTLLGPARFSHIETCASDVCRRFNKIEEMDECIQTLRNLDDLLATLRVELATAREQAGMQDASNAPDNSQAKRAPDYRAMQDSLDLTKAKRLIHARECSIQATKTLIQRCKTST